MEDRTKAAKEQAEQMQQMVENFSTFVNELSQNLPKDQQIKLQEELKKVDISDLSATIKQVNDELNQFITKYKH